MADIVVNFVNWLWKALLYLEAKLINSIIDTFNSLVVAVAAFATTVLDLLPTYTVPTPGQILNKGGILSLINWLMPVNFFVSCLAMMVAAFVVYHTLGPVFRWLKLLR